MGCGWELQPGTQQLLSAVWKQGQGQRGWLYVISQAGLAPHPHCDISHNHLHPPTGVTHRARLLLPSRMQCPLSLQAAVNPRQLVETAQGPTELPGLPGQLSPLTAWGTNSQGRGVQGSWLGRHRLALEKNGPWGHPFQLSEPQNVRGHVQCRANTVSFSSVARCPGDHTGVHPPQVACLSGHSALQPRSAATSLGLTLRPVLSLGSGAGVGPWGMAMPQGTGRPGLWSGGTVAPSRVAAASTPLASRPAPHCSSHLLHFPRLIYWEGSGG